MRKSKHPFLSPAIWIYVLVIVCPTLALLSLGHQSIETQRHSLSRLSAANRLLSGERAAADIEQDVDRLVRECFRDASLLKFSDNETPVLERVRSFRIACEGLRKKHPISDQVFVLKNGQIVYPNLSTTGRGFPLGEARCMELVIDGEQQELQLRRLGRALELYQGCVTIAESNEWKALAKLRAARCLRKMSRRFESESVYSEVATRYGALYDPYDRPYGIIAGLESKRPGTLSMLYSDLAGGRWEVSAEVLDYYMNSLEAQLHLTRPVVSRYIEHAQLARELGDGFRHIGSSQVGEIYSHVLSRPAQVFYSFLDERRILAITTDLNWVSSNLIPKSNAIAISIIPAGGAGTSDGVSVPFKRLFPFWRLNILSSGALPQREEFVFSGVVVLVLLVLVMGIILLSRDLWRQAEATRLRAEFVSAASHELRTPVTAIRLYADTLLENPVLNEVEARYFHEVISKQSVRLGQLIDRVLTFSRIDGGQQQYRFEEGDLGGAIREVLESHREYFSRQGVSLRVDAATVLPLASFDREAVTQAVLNLLDNAAKYSGPAPQIDVTLSRLNGSIVVEVRDRGIGVPGAESKKIFQAFYRSSLHPDRGGYGLGLFVVQQIMSAHRGRVELQASHDGGSRFRLIFPCIES